MLGFWISKDIEALEVPTWHPESSEFHTGGEYDKRCLCAELINPAQISHTQEQPAVESL